MMLCPSEQRMPRVTVGVAVGLLAVLAWGQQPMGEQTTVLEILDRPQFLQSRPESKDISLADYRKLRDECIRRNGHWKPGSALTYEESEPGEKAPGRERRYWLTLESFDETHGWVAELTQYRSKGWDWVARYRLERSTEADGELGITRILEERARVVGGVKYGMTVEEVLRLKGRHYKADHHQEAGSADFVYDDVKASVRGLGPNMEGRVVHVEATTDLTREYMTDIPYEDERPPKGKCTTAEE